MLFDLERKVVDVLDGIGGSLAGAVVSVFELEVLDGQVTDSDIDAEVESLREQNANIMNKEGEAKLGDIATVDYAELDEAGVAIEATKRNDFTFTLGSSYNQYKIDDEVVGMKVGDQKTVDKSYGEDFSDESLRGRSVKLSITLTKPAPSTGSGSSGGSSSTENGNDPCSPQ